MIRPQAMTVLAVAMAAVGCSATAERTVTPWLVVESQRPSLQIVHVAEGRFADTVRIQLDGRWEELLSVGAPPLEFTVLHGGEYVVLGPPRNDWSGWRLAQRGRRGLKDLPSRCSSSARVAGHPRRNTLLCASLVSRAGINSADAPWFFEVVEMAPDGSVIKVVRGAAPNDPYLPVPVGVLADDTPVVAASFGSVGNLRCAVFAVRGDEWKPLSDVPTQSISCNAPSIPSQLLAAPNLTPTVRSGGR